LGFFLLYLIGLAGLGCAGLGWAWLGLAGLGWAWLVRAGLGGDKKIADTKIAGDLTVQFESQHWSTDNDNLFTSINNCIFSKVKINFKNRSSFYFSYSVTSHLPYTVYGSVVFLYM
jgi:hypothetical protein